MGTGGLLDIYTRTTSAHGIATMYHFILIVREPIQKNGFIVFIVAPIEFDYGFSTF